MTRTPSMFIAIVHAADGVRFSTAAATRAALLKQVAGYVGQHVDHQLWPADALEIRTRLRRDELEPAIESYFALVGDRWDDEWLVTAVLGPATPHMACLGGIVTASSQLCDLPA